MAGADRMQVEEVVRKVLVDEHADVLRESVQWLARQLMEEGVVIRGHDIARVVGLMAGTDVEWRETDNT